MHRRSQGALALAAARRRRVGLQLLRHVATAEAHHNRAQAGVLKAESIINFGLGSGFDMSSEVEQLAALRLDLASAEAGLSAARRMAGISHAA